MSKVGISIKLDVSKLDKTRFFKGQKGTYCDLTAFVDLDELDQYGQSGFITQSATKEEREQGVKLPIVGNSTVFYKDSGQQQTQSGYQQPQSQPQAQPADDFDQDIPF
jgi:hypothetical protein